jgi:membrane-associated phospholipid phosphatase
MKRRRSLLALPLAAAVMAAVVLSPGSAGAEESPGAEYLIDGGALPFFWGALGARVAIDTWLRPPPEPRWFSLLDGGKPEADWEVPGWVITSTGGVIATSMLLGDSPARWNHAKGLAQTLATGSVITAALKVTFGRRRPDYRGPGLGKFGGESRSFLSGHSTQAFEIATYSVLYLRDHGFSEGTSGWWRGAAYAGIFSTAAFFAGERVYHHRHHVSDVVSGALLGTVVAVAFYSFQESRLGDDDGDELEDALEGVREMQRARGGFPIAAQWMIRF